MNVESDVSLTVVVNFHNMRREAPRTLESLKPGYQRGVADLAYEVVALDHGSNEPLSPEMVRRIGDPRFRLVRVEAESASPAAAINAVARQSSAEWLMCLIDGARLLSPGVLRYGMLAARLFTRPFVYTIAMHLGHRPQNKAVEHGYDQLEEDRLLATIDWKRNGYALFGVSSVALSSGSGFFSEILETNCFLMRREDYLRIGGLSEEFRSPGGGLVNLDFFNRVHECDDMTPVLLLGEATFHQFHGGVATNVPMSRHPWDLFAEEYHRIRARDFRSSFRPPVYFGELGTECRDLLRRSVAGCDG